MICELSDRETGKNSARATRVALRGCNELWRHRVTARLIKAKPQILRDLKHVAASRYEVRGEA
jgi:hypothetical protein